MNVLKGLYSMYGNLVNIASTIGELQYTKYLKSAFLDTFKWVIRLVYPDWVTYVPYTPKVYFAKLGHMLYINFIYSKVIWVANVIMHLYVIFLQIMRLKLYLPIVKLIT